MTKEQYEASSDLLISEIFNKAIELNKSIINELNISVGDIVFFNKTKQYFTIIDIEFDFQLSKNYWSLPMLRYFGSIYYKNKKTKGFKTYLDWDKIRPIEKNELYLIDSDKQKKVNAFRLNKYKTDPMFKLISTLRGRTLSAFKAKGIKKNTKTELLLGTDFLNVKNYIENKFKPGMNWSNNGHGKDKWQVDHIIPLSSAANEIELKNLCHYTNLQPLWAIENQCKGSKLNHEYNGKRSLLL